MAFHQQNWIEKDTDFVLIILRTTSLMFQERGNLSSGMPSQLCSKSFRSHFPRSVFFKLNYHSSWMHWIWHLTYLLFSVSNEACRPSNLFLNFLLISYQFLSIFSQITNDILLQPLYGRCFWCLYLSLYCLGFDLTASFFFIENLLSVVYMI